LGAAAVPREAEAVELLDPDGVRPERAATFASLAGFLVMMSLDVAIGWARTREPEHAGRLRMLRSGRNRER
jgi:hypothetical protein